MFWIASATYLYLYALETRYLFLLPAAAALAAITFGGYAAAVAKSRIRHLAFAVGTSVATAAFHFVMTFGIMPGYFTRSNPFYIGYQYSLIVIIVNVAIAIYLSILLIKKKREEASLQPKP